MIDPMRSVLVHAVAHRDKSLHSDIWLRKLHCICVFDQTAIIILRTARSCTCCVQSHWGEAVAFKHHRFGSYVVQVQNDIKQWNSGLQPSRPNNLYVKHIGHDLDDAALQALFEVSSEDG